MALALAAPVAPTAHINAFATALAADTSLRQLQLAPDEAKPNFALPDLAGAQNELSRRAKGVVLVHFFATWCEPCREELSSLSRLLDRLGSRQLSVLAISVAEPQSRVDRFVKTAPVNFPVLLDADRTVTKTWGVSALPTTFVLDRNLVARLFVEGDLDWSRADVIGALEEIGADTPTDTPR